MFSRAWIAGVAIGLAISGSALCVQAQVGEGEGQRETTHQESPAGDAPWTFPVEIIEDETETDARQRREQRAEQREIEDLIAQQGMDNATQRMADISEHQTLLILVGTVLLFATLLLTLQANRAAVRAAKAAEGTVEVTRDIARRQLRAYVGTELTVLKDLAAGKCPEMRIIIKNFGQTPAYDIASWSEMEIMKPSEARFVLTKSKPGGKKVLNPSSTYSNYARKDEPLTDAEFEIIQSDTARLYWFGELTYRDAFDELHTTTFRYECGGERLLSLGNMALSNDGNTAD